MEYSCVFMLVLVIIGVMTVPGVHPPSTFVLSIFFSLSLSLFNQACSLTAFILFFISYLPLVAFEFFFLAFTFDIFFSCSFVFDGIIIIVFVFRSFSIQFLSLFLSIALSLIQLDFLSFSPQYRNVLSFSIFLPDLKLSCLLPLVFCLMQFPIISLFNLKSLSLSTSLIKHQFPKNLSSIFFFLSKAFFMIFSKFKS